MDTFFGPYFHFYLETWVNASSWHILCGFMTLTTPTHCSPTSERSTWLRTVYRPGNGASTRGEELFRSPLILCWQGEKWSSQCRPRHRSRVARLLARVWLRETNQGSSQHGQSRQPPCARHVMVMAGYLPIYPTFFAKRIIAPTTKSDDAKICHRWLKYGNQLKHAAFYNYTDVTTLHLLTHALMVKINIIMQLAMLIDWWHRFVAEATFCQSCSLDPDGSIPLSFFCYCFKCCLKNMLIDWWHSFVAKAAFNVSDNRPSACDRYQSQS